MLVWALDDQTTVRPPPPCFPHCKIVTILCHNHDAKTQVLKISEHKRAVVDVQWNAHDGNVIASGASDGSIALTDIRHPRNVIQVQA